MIIAITIAAIVVHNAVDAPRLDREHDPPPVHRHAFVILTVIIPLIPLIVTTRDHNSDPDPDPALRLVTVGHLCQIIIRERYPD